MTPIIIPYIAGNLKLVAWHRQDGDEACIDDPLVDFELTETPNGYDCTITLPSVAAGKLRTMVEPGTIVAVHQQIGTIG